MNQDAVLRQLQARIAELQKKNKKRGLVLAALAVPIVAGLAFDLWELSVLLLVLTLVPFAAILSDRQKIERFQNELDVAAADFERFQNDRTASAQDAARMLQQLHARQRSADAARPRCPTCSSFNVQPISTASRVASVAVLGLASSKIGKTFRCLDCKCTW